MQKKTSEAELNGVEDYIEASVEEIVTALKCPICLSLMTNTSCFKDCMHRFCGECIEKCIRNGKHQCPVCRKKYVSRRELRRDIAMQNLIDVVEPAYHQYEEQQDRSQSARRSMYVQEQSTARKQRHQVQTSPRCKVKFKPTPDEPVAAPAPEQSRRVSRRTVSKKRSRRI